MSNAGFTDRGLEEAFEGFWAGKVPRLHLYEVFTRVYSDRIAASVRSKGVRDPALVEELTQQIVVRIFEKDHLDKYDPKRSRFSTHIFTVINSIVVNSWRRKRTDPLGEAASIQPVLEQDARGVVFECFLKDEATVDPAVSLMRQTVLQELELRMSERHLWSSPVQKRAVRKMPALKVKNTLWQVFTWLYLCETLPFGAPSTPREESIARFLEVTTGSVTNWKRRIREVSVEILDELGLENPLAEPDVQGPFQ